LVQLVVQQLLLEQVMFKGLIMETVICSDCGCRFSAQQSGKTITPEKCPNCGGVIVKLKTTKSNYKTAMIK